MELLGKAARELGKTVVTVSHDLRIRYLVDRVLFRVRWADGVTVDPVCLMVVEKDKTDHILEHDGQKDYFCSAECKREFEANRSKYKDVHISF